MDSPRIEDSGQYPIFDVNGAKNSEKTKVTKYGIRVTINAADHAELVMRERYGSFDMKRHTEVVEPTEQEKADYKEWLSAFELVVKAGEKWIDIDRSGYDDFEDDWEPYLVLNAPKSQTVVVFDETLPEFRARVDEAYAYFAENQEWPADTRPTGSWLSNRLLFDAQWYDYLKRIGDELERLL